MYTRAELARALLIASRLPRFLWEEAMKHIEWVKERSLHSALDGKTPYEMKHQKVPHLGGIHEFSAAAYVKDLKARTLDVCAQLGQFVGYDSESNGYCIYWPSKRSVFVEWNVAFNHGDVTVDATAVIPSDLSEGEKDEIIQVPENNTNQVDENTVNEPQPRNTSRAQVNSGDQNTVPLPSAPEISDALPSNDVVEDPVKEPKLDRGHCFAKKPQGTYSRMHNALPPLEANAAYLGDPDDDGDRIGIYIPEDDDDMFAVLPPDFATVGAMGTEPASIDEAL